MQNILNYRLIIFSLSLIFGIMFSVPSLFNLDSGKKINLGLDLQGGVHMLLGVKSEEAVTNKIKTIASSIKYSTDSSEILIDNISISDDSISFVLLDVDELDNLNIILSKFKGLDISNTNNSFSLSLTPSEISSTKESAIDQVVETIRNRLDQFGLSEPTVIKQGNNDIVVQLPGIKTNEEEQRARNLISKPAKLELMSVNEDLQDISDSISPEKLSDNNSILLPSKNGSSNFVVNAMPILTGKEITDARVVFNQSNQPVISFTLNSYGANIFGDFTSKNIGKRLAVVLDGKVYSAPSINERIGGGSGQISGGFTIEEAGNIAIALKSGALPASIIMLEKRSIGPELGQDSINTSLIALVLGFILVFLFMVIYYGYAGIVSNVALLVNILLIVAVMSLFGATLTLPGMAAIVLTIGIAVDANIIINERIRELLSEGKSVSVAIEKGYDKAMSAIFDANITTLLVAIILYAYGTGVLKGFAVTLSIGILASMLTAILGTHGIYTALLPKINKDKNNKKWFGDN